jgi:hypothetical protein
MVPVVYGLLAEPLERDVVYAGCCVEENAPEWGCPEHFDRG